MKKRKKIKNNNKNYISSQNLFLIKDIQQEMNTMLEKFNLSKIRLFDLPSYKRIFLFILTRARKSYDAIAILCEHGFGQDVATLLRGLFENYITALYIVKHPQSLANQLSARFVDYKWVILKRHLYDDHKKNISGTITDENYRKTIIARADEFKTKYNVISDRGLLTWSGKTLRDMARHLGPELFYEYETVFRLCSRFSHPGILGDKEYLVTDEKHLIFSPLPSLIGVRENLLHSSYIMIGFLKLTNELFSLKNEEQLKPIDEKITMLRKTPLKDEIKRDTDKSPISIRESIIKFDI